MKDVHLTLSEVSGVTGLDPSMISAWINRKWVSPTAIETLDDEDIARIRFIYELQHDFGSNDESIPLILHLVDQLCYLQERMRRLGDN